MSRLDDYSNALARKYDALRDAREIAPILDRERHTMDAYRAREALVFVKECRRLLDVLPDAAVYYLDADIARVVAGAAASLDESLCVPTPDDWLERHSNGVNFAVKMPWFVPDHFGWVWSDAPLPLPSIGESFVNEIGADGPLIISTSPDMPIHGIFWEYDYIRQTGETMLMVYVFARQHGVLRHVQCYRWHPDRPLSMMRTKQSSDAEPLNDVDMLHLKFLLALFLFMRDKIVVPRERPVRRHVARQLERARLDASAPIKIVELRARSYTYAERATPSEREFSCQWIVRGHWRNQYHPSTKSHRPKWIHAHTKGPDDMPLKRPAADIYAVVR